MRRLFGGGAGRRRSTWGYGRQRPRGGFGFFGPFPSYSTRTRGGTRVSVSGCCLPIPLALSVGMLGAVRVLRRR